MSTQPKNLDAAIIILSDTVKENLKYHIVDCPPGFKSKSSKYVQQRCFTVERDPEELLPEISKELEKYGQLGMQWRLDVGFWVTTYDFEGEKFGVLVSLTSSQDSTFKEDNPNYEGMKTFGRFIINDERTKKP